MPKTSLHHIAAVITTSTTIIIAEPTVSTPTTSKVTPKTSNPQLPRHFTLLHATKFAEAHVNSHATVVEIRHNNPNNAQRGSRGMHPR